jgi:crotonobetainyl-CoA:carnitine CoA-transferase CaiB-like acyl-CoA transferase
MTPAALTAASLPLAGVRVVDLCDGGGGLASRFLGDLGADVIRVERPGCTDGACALFRATHHANKRSMRLDLDDDADLATFWDLAATADIVFESSAPRDHHTNPISPKALRERLPYLVVVSLTPFGQSGPYRDWAATDAVHLALAGVLCRSGLPGMDPLLPPGNLATESAAIQAAWSALVAYTNRLDTGCGDHVDASVFESTAQVLDPGFGIGGSATGGVPAADGPRGRPDARHLYPIFPCADGWVRLCILAPRQWRGMFAWLGEPEEFADPEFAFLPKRFAAAGRIYPALERLFATKTRAKITAEGQHYGVPTAALLDPSEVLTADHFAARGTFTPVKIDGSTVAVPNGVVEIDGRRAGLRTAAPGEGEHTEEIRAELAATQGNRSSVAEPRRGRRLPLYGIRVLDLGVIVVGAELGRLLADMGAEVIKVENTAYPDGSRQSMSGDPLTPSFAWGHRNKTSVGLNLRDPRGVDLFKQLAAGTDVVLSNFKPGTLESLGLGYDVLSTLNPGIVMADSSAFGSHGPWSRRMGYGPLVRAETGLSGLWRYPDIDASYSDASTIYPDHVAARVGAVAVLALLLRRRHSGRGGTVSVAQAEVILTQMATELAAESARPGSVYAVGNRLPGDAPRGVYPCAGDDEWCVVTVRGSADFVALAKVIGRPDLAADGRFGTPETRVTGRLELDAALTSWTAGRSPRDVAATLQGAGVPAGMMQRVVDLPHDQHLRERRFFRTMTHPLIPEAMPTENHPALFGHIADAPLEPAPLLGQQSREALHELLGLSHDPIEELITSGVVEETVPEGASASPSSPSSPGRRPALDLPRPTIRKAS